MSLSTSTILWFLRLSEVWYRHAKSRWERSLRTIFILPPLSRGIDSTGCRREPQCSISQETILNPARVVFSTLWISPQQWFGFCMKDGISLYFSLISSPMARAWVRVPAPRPPCRCQPRNHQNKLSFLNLRWRRHLLLAPTGHRTRPAPVPICWFSLGPCSWSQPSELPAVGTQR